MMIILVFVLVNLVTQNLLNAKLDVANSEIDRARVAVEEQINATSASTSLQTRLNAARAALTNQDTNGFYAQTTYEPVIVVNNPDGSITASPEGYRIPERLRSFVQKNQISYQFATIDRQDSSTYKALIIGSPTKTDIPDLQVYLVISMASEESTIALLRGLFSAAGVVIVVLLVGIVWLLIQQVIVPVRSAALIAERFASGHLRERMIVDGEDEMATLAVSFNSMAESLSKKIKQLEEYGNLQRQFTSDVSHELRTPLTTVRMAADLIESQTDDLPESVQRAAVLMQTELGRFEVLLEDLLEISRHDAGVADLSESALDIRSCVASAWQQTQHLAEKLDVPVRFHMYANDDVLASQEQDQEHDLGSAHTQMATSVTGDPRRIERIIRNLLANAIDHSEGNPVDVYVARNEQAIAVGVVDHGVGLKPGQEDLVFNRFWRADPSRVRHSGGTGLGLAISREDAALHGGALEAIGEQGVGTMFRLTLPITPHASYEQSPLELAVPRSLEPEQLEVAADE
ncbi:MULTISPECIES: HAMP domain-containing sensor histidine kinase [unclassified Corynebacterium]|uniref:sensor histidine kinase n=1 Tax=unclassified Corynebacterium TaxID=2624378 RepID=UPI00163D6912|nr:MULTISPECIES: HAMP domain-containing sensor histidine kinase [unclassified Corynebacterium]